MEKASNIFEGEAIESDDDPDDNFNIPPVTSSRNQSSIPSKKEKQGELPSSSVVVSGEASESDDEIFDEMLNSDSFNSSINKSIESDSSTPVAIETRRRRFQSPFHKKIWERNFALRLGIVQSRLESYDDVINKLKSFIPLANRSQISAQETLKNYKQVSLASKTLNDNLEAVLQHTHFPKIRVIST